MIVTGLGKSDTGTQRDHNEDACLVDDDLSLYVVSDGIGGHAAGEVASETAVRSVAQYLRGRAETIERIRRRSAELGDLRALVERAVQTACHDVHTLARNSPGRAGMGATLTLVLVVGDSAVMAHVGDSRLYLYRSGTVHQVTSDHTMVSELIRAGALPSEDARTSPYAHVLTRSVGPQEAVPVDTLVFDVLPGDRLMLCSDGLGDYIDDMELLAMQLGGDDFDAIPENLVRFANESGGHDNVTTVLVRIEAGAPEREEATKRADHLISRMRALESVFLFEDLSLAHLTRVLQACEIVEAIEGEALVREGGPCNRLLVIVDGTLSLIKSGLEVEELGPGKHIGATSLLETCTSRHMVRAKRDSKLLALSQASFWRLLKSRPWLGLALLERLARLLNRERERLIQSLDKHDLPPNSLLPSDLT